MLKWGAIGQTTALLGVQHCWSARPPPLVNRGNCEAEALKTRSLRWPLANQSTTYSVSMFRGDEDEEDVITCLVGSLWGLTKRIQVMCLAPAREAAGTSARAFLGPGADVRVMACWVWSPYFTEFMNLPTNLPSLPWHLAVCVLCHFSSEGEWMDRTELRQGHWASLGPMGD